MNIFTIQNRQQQVRREYHTAGRRYSASVPDLCLDLHGSVAALGRHVINAEGGPLAERCETDAGALLDDCLVKLCAVANALGVVLDVDGEAGETLRGEAGVK